MNVGRGYAHADDPWAVLGIPVTADDAAIRTAYRSALREHPPESDPEGFKRIRAAYEALRDAESRTRTALFERFLIPELPPVTPADLGVRPPAHLGWAELLEDLRRVLLSGTELDRTDFTRDLRTPPG